MNILRPAATLLLGALSLLVFAQQTDEPRQFSLNDGLPSNLVAYATQDDHGLMWFGTWRGMCYFDGYDFITLDNDANREQSPLNTRVHSMRQDADGGMWLITYDNRIYRYDTRKCTYTDVSQIIEEALGGREVRVRNVYALKKGVVWLTCWDGSDCALRFEDIKDLKKVSNEYPRLTPNCGNLSKVVQDKQGNEWLETKDGDILKWQPGKAQLKAPAANEAKKAKQQLNDYNTTQQPNAPVRSMLQTLKQKKHFIDRQNNLWGLGTKLSKQPAPATLAVTTIHDSDVPVRVVAPLRPAVSEWLYCQLLDSRGRYWQGYKGGGVLLNGKPCNEDMQGKDVYDIFEDSRGHVWVACYDGGFNLAVEKADGSVLFVNPANKLKDYPKDRHQKVRHITETADGVIILSTADGIVCFSSNFNRPEDIRFHAYQTSRKDKSSIPGGNVMQVLQATDGKIYISTMSGGLTTIASGHPLKDNLRFAPVEGTTGNRGIVLTFIEDDNKSLWLARENFLEKYDTRTGVSTIFGKRNFGENITFSEALPLKDPKSGDITMGLSNGRLTFNPKTITNSSYAPPIIFSNVQYQGSLERHPILYTDELDVPADCRNLTIYFSALDYQDNELIQYAYKILKDPKDLKVLNDLKDPNSQDHWNYVGRAHCASFNNLPCGHLQLLVRSTNADGVWTDNMAVLNIYSHPTFWETGWAWLLYIIILIGIVYVAVYIVLMRQRHRQEREEMERKLEQLLASLNVSAESGGQSSEFGGQGAESGGQSAGTGAPNGRSYALPEVQIEPEEKKIMEKLMAYLDENIGNRDMKIGELADALGMSRTVFYERLKNITGMSPIDFVRYLRIQRAKQMLKNSDLSISQIAYEVGFSEPNYFSKSFKKIAGVSPKEFRAQLDNGAAAT